MEPSFFYPKPDDKLKQPELVSGLLSEQLEVLSHTETDDLMTMQEMLATWMREKHEAIPISIVNQNLIPMSDKYARGLCEAECLLALHKNRSVWFEDYANALSQTVESMWNNSHRPQLLADQFLRPVPTLRERWRNRSLDKPSLHPSEFISTPSSFDLTFMMSDWYMAQHPNDDHLKPDYSLSVKCVRDVFVSVTEDIYRNVSAQRNSR